MPAIVASAKATALTPTIIHRHQKASLQVSSTSNPLTMHINVLPGQPNQRV